MTYPKEWNTLPRNERREKIKELKKINRERTKRMTRVKKFALFLSVFAVLIVLYLYAVKKTPEQIAFEKEIDQVSLEGKVEEFPIEGADHISFNDTVSYQTNPPTSGKHLSQAENWGIYNEEIDDKAAVHGLEHGGIWISYKEIDEETKEILTELGRQNPASVIVSPRSANEDGIAVVSWGRMMRLEGADRALIQKYIDTYKNQSPEKLAR